MIIQSAFYVRTSLGKFIGIVAFDNERLNAIQAAKHCWGAESAFTELSWEELAKPALKGLQDLPVYTSSVN